MQETREHIKSRILKNVARLWGYTETEAESNFDPMVSMLLGACATEMEKISGEIHASRARVMERLVQLLSPDTLTGALPAHAVASALPVETATELKPDTQFYTRLKQGFSNDTQEAYTKDIFFSPTDSFHLNRASVRFMATGNHLFKVFSNQKEVISTTTNSLPPSTLWLAIDEPEVSLHHTSFYFDIRNEADKQLFYHQLPKAKWFYYHVPLEHIPGYGNREISGETFDMNSIYAAEYSIFHKVRKQVNAYYKPYFITLLDDEGITNQEGIYQTPSFVFDTFKGKEVDLIGQQPLRWIRIQFPETVSNRLLQDTICITNCFPIINRQVHEVNYRLQDIINVIPLHSDDIFLDLEEVNTDDNKPLAVHAFQQDNQGFVMLMRNGGIGRFDERDAASMIDYLLQLLRDESAAFSILDNDFVSGEIKQLQQVMNKLEQRLFSRQIHRGSSPYLVIHHNQRLPKQSLFIKYCSTNGQEANNIKAGTRLHPYNGASIISNSVFLASPSRGGRDKLSTTESVLAYKSALLSKDRLITTEDIKAFCYYQLGHRLKNISIQKSMMINPDEQQGYKKTIDVILFLHEDAYNDMSQKGELSFWEEHLTHLLEEKSVAWMPYRVFTKKAI